MVVSHGAATYRRGRRRPTCTSAHSSTRGQSLWGVLVVRVEVDGTWLERTDLTLAEAVGHTLATLLSRSGDADTPADPHVDPRMRDERHHDDHVRDDRESRDERDEFVSLAAARLRSPLTTVKGYAQLLLRAARKDLWGLWEYSARAYGY